MVLCTWAQSQIGGIPSCVAGRTRRNETKRQCSHLGAFTFANHHTFRHNDRSMDVDIISLGLCTTLDAATAAKQTQRRDLLSTPPLPLHAAYNGKRQANRFRFFARFLAVARRIACEPSVCMSGCRKTVSSK